MGVRFVNPQYDYRQFDDTKSCYQLIKTMKKYEKEIRHRLYVFIKMSTVNSAKCDTTARAHDAFCPLTLTVPLTYDTVQLQA